AQAIAAAIRQLAGDRAALARMSEASRPTIVAGYPISRLAAELSGVYAQPCARAPSRRGAHVGAGVPCARCARRAAPPELGPDPAMAVESPAPHVRGGERQ